MLAYFFQLARVQTPLLLVLFDLVGTALSGGSITRVLRRERRRRARHAARRAATWQ